MKITNLSSTKTLGFNDLGLITKGVSPDSRHITLAPNASMYLLDTGDVLLSAQMGDISRYLAAGLISVDDEITADTLIEHNLGFPPKVECLVLDGADWVLAAPGVDFTATHNAAFTELNVVLLVAGTYRVRLF